MKMKISRELFDIWKVDYDKAAIISREKLLPAIDLMKTILERNFPIQEIILSLVEKDPDHWYTGIVNVNSERAQVPMSFHSLGGGMYLRNLLRDNGFDDDYFGVGLDYVYVGIIEEALFQKRITKDGIDDIYIVEE
jgi:hypothetical protein